MRSDGCESGKYFVVGSWARFSNLVLRSRRERQHRRCKHWIAGCGAMDVLGRSLRCSLERTHQAESALPDGVAESDAPSRYFGSTAHLPAPASALASFGHQQRTSAAAEATILRRPVNAICIFVYLWTIRRRVALPKQFDLQGPVR